ncbi:MFS-type transporter SLC18B1-like isoform X1 [Argiope bruennichi]|uniref:MFS-type transporter SLC18B1 like protein n=2 Tax=Argiope bruennichi TaxID=94029 RepID=A0A8T0FM39_ARGBR|nr:MFS-type transporter SLC18B1-like isoform X1 [Argiope bruennichi]KAF8791572.1 MFS-type transporter SLC18B1 like protein [Argiope bruennichi]
MDLLDKIDEMRDQNENTTENFSKSEKSIYGSIEATFTPKPEEEVKKKKKYTKTQWLTLITLAFGNFCAGACVSLQAPFFPSEAEKKGATATEYGFIFGIFQLTIFVTAPLMGKIVPYTSPKFLLNTGILTVGVTCILFGTLDLVLDTTSFVALAFVIRTVEGVGAAALRTSCYTIIASQFLEGIGTTFAVLETFLGVGLITGPTLGGALYDLGGYGLPFWTVGTVVVIDAIVIFFFLPDVENPNIPEKGSILKFWFHPRTMLYSLSVFTSFNYIGFNQTTLEPHLRSFDLSGVLLGLMFALSGSIYAFTAPGWGWLCDKKCNSLTLSLLGCIINIFSLLLIGPAPFFNTGPKIWIVIISLILMGLGLGAKLVCAFTGTLQDTMNRGLPPDLSTYGLVSSMIAASQSLGAFVGPSVGGYLLDNMGFRKASMTLLVLETVLIILLIVSICNRGSWVKKAELKHSTEKISMRNGYVPKDEECGKNSISTISK